VRTSGWPSRGAPGGGTSGDASDKKSERRGRGVIGVPIEDLHAAIRDVPKPVIAKVRGYAIGGGNVLVTLCDTAESKEGGNAFRERRKPRFRDIESDC
jgi:2-ketocyclohexanecarboxyl-CoA hydrolase